MRPSQFHARIAQRLDGVIAAGEIFDVDDMAAAIAKELAKEFEVQRYLFEQLLPQLVRQQAHRIVDARGRLGGRTVPKVERSQPTSPARSTQAPSGAPIHTSPPVQPLPMEQRLIQIGSNVGPVKKMRTKLQEEASTYNIGFSLEIDPVSELEVRLFSMTRRQLLDAAQYRHNKAAGEVHHAAFLRNLADTLNDRQLVSDVHDNLALTRLWASTTALEEFSVNVLPPDQKGQTA